MRIQELDTMTQIKDLPCVSIIIPILPPEGKKNLELLKRSVQRAKTLLKAKQCDEEIKASIALKIDETVRVLPVGSYDGLGVFISSRISNIIPFPFAVEKKVVVQDHFETRDLLYLRQYLTPYYLLSLSNRVVRLYNATMDKLEEINDENFPLIYEEQYKNARPGHQQQ